jgi:hypothetical protein
MTVRGYALLLRAGSASDRWLVPALALGARIRGAESHMKVEVGQPAQRPVLPGMEKSASQFGWHGLTR